MPRQNHSIGRHYWPEAAYFPASHRDESISDHGHTAARRRVASHMVPPGKGSEGYLWDNADAAYRWERTPSPEKAHPLAYQSPGYVQYEDGAKQPGYAPPPGNWRYHPFPVG